MINHEQWMTQGSENRKCVLMSDLKPSILNLMSTLVLLSCVHSGDIYVAVIELRMTVFLSKAQGCKKVNGDPLIFWLPDWKNLLPLNI